MRTLSNRTAPVALLLGALLAGCLFPSTPAAQDDAPQAGRDNRLMLRFGEFDPLVGAPPMPPSLMAGSDNRLFIVQFRGPIVGGNRDALRRAGAEVHTYLPSRSYVVRAGSAALANVRGLQSVRWVGALHLAYKLEPEIIASLASDIPMHAARYNIVLVDVRRDAARLERAIVAVGGQLNMRAEGGLVVSATLTRSQLVSVANLNTVLWIDRFTAPGLDMNNARIQTGATYVELVAGIDGKGISGHVNEGINTAHREFAARPPYRTKPIGVFRTSSTSHGTSTAGIIFAQGVTPGAKGFMPFGQMYYTNMEQNRARLFAELNRRQVLGATASWGGGRTTSYNSMSAAMDLAIFDNDIFVTQSHSNSGAAVARPEAWAKNITSVGGFRHYNNANPNDDCWCGTGSTGPAADGRIGITLTGYYDSVHTTSGTSGSPYTTGFGGTSSATPMCNGLGLAAIEMFTNGFFGYPGAPSWQQRWDYRPHFTTTKTLLIATTEQLWWSNANRMQQGWGFPNLREMYDRRGNMLVLDEEDVLTQGGSRSYFVFVKPGTNELRIAMTYADPPAAPLAGIHRVNNLDLRVAAPNNRGYWGNNGLTQGLYSTPGGSPNDRDTEECVFLRRPAGGIYRVTVSAPAIRQDSHVETKAVDADFALVVNGIGGGRGPSGPQLDLISSAPGQFDVSLTNLPTSAWTGGYTMFSFDTRRHVALGNVFGLELDALAAASLRSAQLPGNVFAFTRTAAPGAYPNATFRFPAPVAVGLQGLTFDGVALVHDAAQAVLAVSNVDRVTIQ